MTALMPVGGDGRSELAQACFFCEQPSVGPCAMCELAICASSTCSHIIPAIPGKHGPAVVCVDCKRGAYGGRGGLAMIPVSAAGALMLVWAVFFSPQPNLAWMAMAAILVVLPPLIVLLIRWQWLRRLSRIRPAQDSSQLQ